MREHLEGAARRGDAHAQAKLTPPPLPRSYVPVLGWFFQLHRRRGVGMHGEQPVSWTDMDAWSRMTGHQPTRDELQLLERCDMAYFAAKAERRHAGPKK